MKRCDPKKDTLLFVDDRPVTLSHKVLERNDINIVFLRFDGIELPGAYLEQTADHHVFFVSDTERPEGAADRFVAWASNNKIGVRYFLNHSEPAQHFSQAFARCLGLPALTAKQTDIFRNKVIMKTEFAGKGFAVTPFEKLEKPLGKDRIMAFAKKHGWPVILKPIDGFATIDTYRLDENNIAGFVMPGHRSFMIEKFIEGREYQCCALIANKTVVDVFISYVSISPLEIVTAGNTLLNNSITLNKNETAAFPVDMKRYVQSIVDAFDVDHAYLHMEFFLTPSNTIVMSEAALRLAGLEIPADHGFSRGFDIFNALIDIHLMRPVTIASSLDRNVGDLQLPIKVGRILRMTSLDELRKMEGVIAARLRFGVGDTVARRRASHSSSGVVHVEGNSVVQVESKMRRIMDAYVFEVE